MLNPKTPTPGPERLILALALLAPLGLVAVMLAQIPGINLGVPSSVVYADSSSQLVTSHPAPSNPAPPPTLAPPTATPQPTATPVPASPTPAASPTPQTGRKYTVRPGDQLKDIAASYHLSIWQIINTNNIPNPDSLRVGQELQIPDS
jgi:LysM repeat protein